jgi:hypothetical protein
MSERNGCKTHHETLAVPREKKKKRTHDAPFAAELPGFVTIYETKRSKRSKRSQFQDKWYLLPSKNI